MRLVFAVLLVAANAALWAANLWYATHGHLLNAIFLPVGVCGIALSLWLVREAWSTRRYGWR